METQTIAKKALELLSSIPEDEWIIDKLTDDKGKCCMLGHYSRCLSRDSSNYSIDNIGHDDSNIQILRIQTSRFLRNVHNLFEDGTIVNNSPNVNGYNEPIIKDRVIHLLKDMVEAGY